MPRRPLAEISGNRAPNCELSPYQRGKIERSRELGQSIRAIAKDTKFAASTVQTTLEINPQRNEAVTLQRSGRPKKYSTREQRRIVKFVRINPKSTYEDIRQNLHIYLSHDTFGRILDSVRIKNWRAKGRPTLEPRDVKIRWDWARVYCEWLEQWKSIIFSDECSVERGKGAQRE